MSKFTLALWAVAAIFFSVVSGPAPLARAQIPSESALHAPVFVDRGVVAYTEGRYEEALKELEQALKLDPENVDALYYQGLVYAAMNRPADAIAALERARKLRPTDPDAAFQLGALYFGQKDYEKAEPFLKEVYRVDPKRPNLGYYLGFIEFGKQNFREALTYFKANVPSDNDFDQLNRFYTALTLARLGAPGEAKAEIEQAIRLQPASPLTAPAQRLGEVLAGAEQEGKRFTGQLRLGTFYDTNVPVVPGPVGAKPSPPALTPPKEPEVAAFRAKSHRQATAGSLTVLDLEYKWLKTGNASEGWEGAISHRFLQTYNFNEHLRDFNTQNQTPTASILHRGMLPSFLASLPYSAGAQVSYDYISLGNAPFFQRWIFSPYLSVVENSWNATTLVYRYQSKDFFHDEKAFVSIPLTPKHSDVQDAANQMVGLLHFFLFEKGRHYAKIGYQYDHESAEGDNWDYSGHRLLAGFQYTFPWWDLRLRYDLDYHWRFYDNKNTLHPGAAPNTTRRRDNEPIQQVALAKDLSHGLNVGIEYLYDRGDSNLGLYDFRRHVITTSVAWRF
ncbi:MAG TPA: tetratricopeptide repeat protein [Candidatus Binatia bacterium]